MEICSFGFPFVLANDSFPIQSSTLEIQQERQFEPTDRQITNHLRDMRLVKCCDDLRINDNEIIYNQVGHEIADQLAVVEDGKASLHLDRMTASLKLKYERAFVKLFIQTGPQLIQNIHRGADDFPAQFFVN